MTSEVEPGQPTSASVGALTRPTPQSPTGAEGDGLTQVRSEPTVAFGPSATVGIAGYELVRELARGGMGAVYLARDTALGREVAVKVMLPQMSAVAFVRESQIAAKLPHPGIPPVHALGTLPDGRPFLAMKLIQGETLDVLLRARPDPSAERGRFVAAFEQMCQAVGYAHSQGVVHRDLKPANVMVGAFGEVQVMDWGLAKTVGAADDTAAGVTVTEDVAATVAGTVKGTPAYMAPEQARGEPVDARADVFALGGILAAVLTGSPPFAGTSVRDTIVRAAKAELDGVYTRLDGCGADEELVAVARRCLAARPEDRPATGATVAAAVSAYRAGVDARLLRAERDRAVSAAEVREQRKRRRVQLALAGVVAAALAGAGIATALVLEQRAADNLAAEKRQSEERLAAEQRRQEDLRAADAAAQAQQRRARAGALVPALGAASTTEVPRVIEDLKAFRALVAPELRALAARPVGEKPGLHARLALMTDEPAQVGAVAEYVPTCRPDELLTVRDALKPHAAAVAPGLWAVLLDAKADRAKRVRAAGALAGLAPADGRWGGAAAAVADAVVRADPAEFVVWSEALEPVRGALVPDLLGRYAAARADIRGGKLDESALVAAVGGYNMTADLLARYTRDRRADLAELAVIADARHYRLFAAAIEKNKAEVAPLLLAELAKAPPEHVPVAKLDAALEAHGKRRGYAAAALVALGEGGNVWELFEFPKDGDPTARSYLLERLTVVGADPLSLVQQFNTEADVSAKQSLLVALGEFPPERVPAAERQALSAKLVELYRRHSDPGLHSAIGWLLRQKAGDDPGGFSDKWGKAEELVAVDADLAREARGRVAARAVAGAAVPFGLPSELTGPQLPCPSVAKTRDWFVNGEGQTFAVVRGPVEFALGAPKSEPGRNEGNEPQHRKRIGRTFAIATKEVTVAEFLRFRPQHSWTARSNPGPDKPAVAVTWYEATSYCNWLSAREGIPPDQWCYEPNKGGAFDEGMRMKAGHLKLTGYRLPTEAEWEFACRGGTVTARYHGRGEELLPRYGWCAKNAEERSRPVGRLRPNELGLFDMLGNAFEWTEEPARDYAADQAEDLDNTTPLPIDERAQRLLRGGSFFLQSVHMRSANRYSDRPGYRDDTYGFRAVRTLP